MELIGRSNDQRELIKLTQQNINNEMIKTVNARELHKELGVGRDFSHWIKNRLDTLGSLEDQDYIILKGESLLAKLASNLKHPPGVDITVSSIMLRLMLPNT